jgi:hypothetical protein
MLGLPPVSIVIENMDIMVSREFREVLSALNSSRSLGHWAELHVSMAQRSYLVVSPATKVDLIEHVFLNDLPRHSLTARGFPTLPWIPDGILVPAHFAEPCRQAVTRNARFLLTRTCQRCGSSVQECTPVWRWSSCSNVAVLGDPLVLGYAHEAAQCRGRESWLAACALNKQLREWT